MQLSITLLTILGLAVANPDIPSNQGQLSLNAVARNSVLENVVLGLLEEFRGTMLTGSDDVPVLDPLEVEHLHLDDQIIPVPGAQVTIKDLKVLKLSTFVVDSLTISTVGIIPPRYRVAFDFHVPVLELNAANYDLAVSAAGVNIFGNGDAKINLTELRVKGSLVLTSRISIGSGLHFTITSSDVNLSLKGFDSQINGLMNDKAMSDFINIFLRKFVPEAVQMYEKDVSKILSDTVQEIGNELLADFDLAGIFG